MCVCTLAALFPMSTCVLVTTNTLASTSVLDSHTIFQALLISPNAVHTNKLCLCLCPSSVSQSFPSAVTEALRHTIHGLRESDYLPSAVSIVTVSLSPYSVQCSFLKDTSCVTPGQRQCRRKGKGPAVFITSHTAET